MSNLYYSMSFVLILKKKTSKAQLSFPPISTTPSTKTKTKTSSSSASAQRIRKNFTHCITKMMLISLNTPGLITLSILLTLIPITENTVWWVLVMFCSSFPMILTLASVFGTHVLESFWNFLHPISPTLRMVGSAPLLGLDLIPKLKIIKWSGLWLCWEIWTLERLDPRLRFTHSPLANGECLGLVWLPQALYIGLAHRH